MKKDYVVIGIDDYEEKVFDGLTSARKYAKSFSKNIGCCIINRWVYDEDIDDMVLDEKFEIKYENGIEIK